MGGACSKHEEMRNAYKIIVGKPNVRGYSGDLGVEGRIILKWIVGKQCWKVWI
jgi:hypothetical protein